MAAQNALAPPAPAVYEEQYLLGDSALEFAVSLTGIDDRRSVD